MPGRYHAAQLGVINGPMYASGDGGGVGGGRGGGEGGEGAEGGGGEGDQ